MGSNFTGLTVTWLDESDGYATTAEITAVSIPLFTDTGSGEVNECEIVISAKGGKHVAASPWVTSTPYVIDDLVKESSKMYTCLVAHSSGVFATDLGAGKWAQIADFDKYDRIRIEVTDLGSNSYDKYFEIQDIIPSQSKQEGSLVTLECLGIEYHTQMIHYARRDWFENAFDIGQKIGDAYEANNGSKQPLIDRHDEVYTTGNQYGNGLPTFTNNHYEFGASEDSCYNRWLDVIDLLGGAATSGGVGNFYDITFDSAGANLINTAIFVSGARSFDGNDPTNDASAVVIENTDSINVSEQEGGISNPTATKIAAWGSPTHGSLPTGTAKYRAGELEFIFRPQWKTGIPYVEGAKVLNGANGRHYRAGPSHTGNNSTVFATDLAAGWWVIMDMSSEFGDDVQYSQWTEDKAKLWANAGADPDAVSSLNAWATTTAYKIGTVITNGGVEYLVIKNHTSDGTAIANDLALSPPVLEVVESALMGNGAAFFDSNIVVRDDGVMFRTWVNEVIGDTDYDTVTDQSLSNEYLHANNANPIGHRVLNVSNTSLSGVDQRGRNFDDAVVQWANAQSTGDNGQWEVLYEQPTATLNKMQVFDIKDKKIWEWDNATSKWEDKTTVSPYLNYDCSHSWKSIYNIAGSDPRPTKRNTTPFNEDNNDFAKNVRPAVEVCYEYATAAHDFVSVEADTKKGAWLNFGFPFPVSTYHGISEGVGDIYGGGTNEQASLVTQPSLLDTQNMTWTSDGKIGFNHTTSEELGPISSLSFNTRVKMHAFDGTALGGRATCRVTMFDTKDNVVTQDFEIRFTDGKSWQSVNLSIGGFTIYRGRMPKNWEKRWAATIFGIEIPIQELDIQDIFEFNHIKYITFQIQDFYDDEGRYAPQNELLGVDNTTGLTAAGGFIRFAIDALHFKKTLLAITGQPSTQNIEPQFLQRPNIISYNQLKNEALSELEIQQFRLKVFNFQTSGNVIFDIPFGETFFLKNTEIVSDASYTESTLGADDGTAGTVRLVAKRIEYHLTKPSAGPGGITRSIKGVRRYTI